MGGRCALARVPEAPGGRPVSVRAYFPARIDAAVRQKARWMTGIALAGWDRTGWGRARDLGDHWMRMRDRRATIEIPVLATAYCALVLWGASLAGHAVAAVPAPALAAGDALAARRQRPCCSAGGLAVRAAFVGRAYGWREACWSAPRVVTGNFIALLAGAARGVPLCADAGRRSPALGQDRAPLSRPSRASDRMSGRGRPLRFLAAVVAGWIGLRILLLWPQAWVASGGDPRDRAGARCRRWRGCRPRWPAPRPHRAPAAPARRAAARARPVADPARIEMALLSLLQFGRAEYADAPPSGWLAPRAAAPGRGAPASRLAPMDDRWSASAWLVARGGAARAAAPGESQLGGGQAGVRVSYVLDRGRRIAVFGRVSAPLAGAGREAALGIEWQPARVPVRLVARAAARARRERRRRDRARAGRRVRPPFGRLPPRKLWPGGRGAARAARALCRRCGAATRTVAGLGGARLALGGGAWGAAQRDAARFDLGPSATLALPAGRHGIRFALDWRQRIAGEARPGSGLALTIGSDF